MKSTRDIHGSRHAPALLDMLADTAMDADYFAAAQAKEREYATATTTVGKPLRRSGGPAIRLMSLMALGILVATGLVQTAKSEPAAVQGRAELLDQVQAGQEAIRAQRARLAMLQRELSRLDAVAIGLGVTDVAISAQAARAATLAAAEPLVGPGVEVTVADAPGATSARERVLDKDLQRLVNAFWAAGAQAIAINGVRLTALSSIRTAGEAITVDYRSVRSPYGVTVVGEPNGLQTGFVDTTHGRYWYELSRAVGVTLEITPRARVEVPAARRLGLRQARTWTDVGGGADEMEGPGVERGGGPS